MHVLIYLIHVLIYFVASSVCLWFYRHKLMRVVPQTDLHIQTLKKLEADFPDVSFNVKCITDLLYENRMSACIIFQSMELSPHV